MIIAILDGWSSNQEVDLEKVVLKATEGVKNRKIMIERASPWPFRSRKIRRFVCKNQNQARSLLCIGKSLGAKHLIERVLNRLPTLDYYMVGLVTIDPCWPLWNNFRPNLNFHDLVLRYPVDIATNVYYRDLSGRNQAGSLVKGFCSCNIAVEDTNHAKIAGHSVPYLVIKGAAEILCDE